MNWNWPATPENNYAAWYTILRRGLAYPWVVLGRIILITACWVGWGTKAANKLRDDIC